MRFSLSRQAAACLASTVLLALATSPSFAQELLAFGRRGGDCPPAPCPAPTTERPITPTPTTPTTPTPTVTEPSPLLPDTLASAVGGEGVALASSSVGYIDPALPQTMFRFRFDAAYRNNRPDRAEFFYAKCGCFRNAIPPDPNAAGPPLTETRVDYQDFASYLEVAYNNRVSGFVEIPVRLLNPERNNNTSGLADMNAGFKVAMIACEDTVFTFQFRTYIPTGDSDRGLGTDHVSLEPGLLLLQRLGERLVLEAEFKDWVPVGGSDFAGNVLRYGVGLSYQLGRCGGARIAPVAEFVGWTVLDGKESDFTGATRDAAGDTIVNAKLGVRLGLGDYNSLYVGYGRALTGDVWYKDIVRVEYRVAF
ncbi:MAG TPA: hypothetical protein VKI65_03465 [Gemmataceae bacterium]|nr:hypothetical protein [Gemmataceae bacterium]